MRQNAKEVKVIHRWRADEFDGEIPIGGDEEMLGTAMKVANQVGNIQDSIAEGVETAMPMIKNAVWLNAHIGAPFAVANGAYKLGTGRFDSWKLEAGKIGYGLGSVIGNAAVNGKYSSFGSTLRGVATMVGSGIVGAQVVAKKLGVGGRFAAGSMGRNVAIGCYTVAGASYAYKKFMGGQ